MDPAVDGMSGSTGSNSSDSGDELQYDPAAPVLYGHQIMELVFVCALNALSGKCPRIPLSLIVASGRDCCFS